MSSLDKLPSSIRYLLLEDIETGATKAYPSVIQIASLVREMNLLQVNSEDFENKLNSALNVPSTHSSSTYLLQWKKAHESEKVEYKA